MPLKVRIVGILISLVGRRLYNIFKYAPYVSVHILNRKGTVFYCGNYPVGLKVESGFHEVVARLHGFYGAGLVAPVRHHNAAKAPFVAEDVLQKVVALLGKDAVDLVVGAHKSPGIRFPDHYLKPLQAHFAERPGVHTTVGIEAVQFYVICRKMLGAYSHALALDTAYPRCSHLAGKEGVFAVILKVTAAKGIALKVHSGTKDHVQAVFPHFLSHKAPETGCKVLVPGRCHCGTGREAGGVVSVVAAGPGGVNPDAGCAIGHTGAGEAEALKGTGGERCSRDPHGAAFIVEGFFRYKGGSAGNPGSPGVSNQEAGLLFKGHGGKDSVNIGGLFSGASGKEYQNNDGCGFKVHSVMVLETGLPSGILLYVWIHVKFRLRIGKGFLIGVKSSAVFRGRYCINPTGFRK